MKIKRIVSIILVVLMTITVLSACSIGKAASLPADVDENGRFIYSIIRGENSSNTISDAAKTLRSAIKDSLGGKAAVAKDNAVEAVDGSCEILLGNTNRVESQQALEVITNNRNNNTFDFVIKVINNKICIQATNDDMVAFAVECFAESFCKDAESWNLLTSDFEYLYTPETDVVANLVSGVDFGYYTFVKPVSIQYIITHQVEQIISFYKNNGFVMDFVEDIDEEKPNEILIGDTSREESKSVTVEGDNYIIKVVGSKLVVKGGNELSTYRAVEHLLDLLKESKEKGAFNWTDGYVINGKYDAEEKGTYTLNFNDEFNTSTVNKNVWGDNNSAALQVKTASTLGGVMYQIDISGKTLYKEKPLNPNDWIYQADGSLHLGSGKIGEKDFLKSAVSTFSSMLYKYGYCEIRAKLPGQDYSAGLWLNGTGEQNLATRYGDIGRSCMTEIDIMENYGSTKYFGSCIHRWWSNYTADGQSTFQGHTSIGGDSRYHNDENDAEYFHDLERYGTDLADDYHIYSFYWDDTQYSFALDGREYLVYDFKGENSVSVHCLMDYLIFSNMTGNASYGSAFKPGETAEYAEMLIDYVRLYQSDRVGSQMVKGDGQYVEKVNPNNTVIMYPEHPVKGSY